MKPTIKFDPLVWRNWEERFIREEEEAYRQMPAEEPTEAIPSMISWARRKHATNSV